VYLNYEFVFGISRFIGISLKQGEKINESMIANLLVEDAREKAFQRALRFIHYRPRTVHEVRKKLDGLGFENDVIDNVLNELIEKRHLNDREFAENWVASRSHSKPRSHKMLEYELKNKSIQESIIQEALEFAPDDKDLAIQLGKKYLRRFGNLDEKEFEKISNLKVPFIQLRGQWVEVDIHQIKKLTKMKMSNGLNGKIPVGELLRLNLSDEEIIPGVSVDNIDNQEAVEHFFQKLFNLNNIEKFYGANKVLDNITFDVQQGEIVGIIGKNGCGKTTIFKIISGLEQFDKGDLFIRKGVTLGYQVVVLL